MKIKRIIIGLAAAMLFTACNTDIEQDRQMSSEIFWNSSDDVARALMGCYGRLPQDVYGAYKDGYADIVYCQYPWESNATNIASGNFNDGMNDGYNFQGLRRFNYFLDNVDKASMDAQTKKANIAEVRVLRAWWYYEMIKKFGPMPLFKHYITKAEEAKVAPTSEEDLKKFIVSEIEESLADLPEYPIVKSRIGKAAALAVKARIHLFYKEYPQAAEASKKIMNMGAYNLFKVNNLTADDKKDDYSKLMTFSNEEEKEKFLKGLRSYEKLFWEQNKENSEVIFNIEYIKDRWNFIGRYFLPTNVYGGWASITPTNNLIVQYWDKNGNEFTSPTIEERATRFKKGVEQGNWDEYLKEFKDRDTRLYASILFPQAPWYAAMQDSKFEWRDQGSASNTSKTGYNFRKMVDPTDPTYVKAGIQDFPEIRLAEVLITFAEAQNEVGGPFDEVYAAINKLRDRVGMPEVAKGKNQDELREIIRRERCIELAGEGFRWDDIRRWEISSKVMKNLFSINGGSVQKRHWEPKFVRLPYPRTAIDRNPNLEAAQKAKGY
ncbi:RagB/SusD family nutrient uptake outer membrane protein [Ornithobacterium rhinotracheale]|uniref:RagB/SusD family nutrient uptake outer membrane protein n=1 Tax=Ornithobacterium rhinotracheale TaxID=28251 RepID=UPI002158AB78|nr:RagB/SusD family nutrient uptake outer membrane protein [Ornithobacterium rhinotracheale]UVD88131.1 RagB/SusD family nutrient uptake outer membrane protein [Ornithobacterium rhinotracheale]